MVTLKGETSNNCEKNILPSFSSRSPPIAFHAQPEWQEHEWKATLNVVDENGKPVSEAKVSIGYDVPQPPGEHLPAGLITGLTDRDGVFSASHRDKTYGLGFQIEKAGYYQTWINHGFGIAYDPQKWHLTLTLVLKKIGQPIPMYARRAQIEIPATNNPAGFDLIEYDWVPPYGKGKQSDIFFEVQRRWVSRRDFDCTVKTSFPNHGDGLIAVPASADQGSSSGPRLAVTAPSDGYTPEVQRTISYVPGRGIKSDSKDQNYYLRIRTVLDEQGHVRSALYGKIYGDFSLDPINSKKSASIIFQYYLNPEPNSLNVEFDPAAERILFGRVPSLQEVQKRPENIMARFF